MAVGRIAGASNARRFAVQPDMGQAHSARCVENERSDRTVPAGRSGHADTSTWPARSACAFGPGLVRPTVRRMEEGRQCTASCRRASASRTLAQNLTWVGGGDGIPVGWRAPGVPCIRRRHRGRSGALRRRGAKGSGGGACPLPPIASARLGQTGTPCAAAGLEWLPVRVRRRMPIIESSGKMAVSAMTECRLMCSAA